MTRLACAAALLVIMVTPAHAQNRATATRADDRAAPARTQEVFPPEIVHGDQHDFPVIELVTMGVGSLIWERHGHIALCVREADPRNDHCYNYGIGDFYHPLGMTWGFFRGARSFWVGKMPRVAMLEVYVNADRTIW